MKGKKVFSILAVAMLAFCALFVVAADTDAKAADVKEKAVLFDFKDSDYKKLSKVVNQYSVESLILEAFDVSPPNSDDFDLEMKLGKVSFSNGMKAIVEENTILDYEYTILSVDFTIKLTAKENDVKLETQIDNTFAQLLDSPVFQHYIYSLTEKSFAKGDVIEFTGKIINKESTAHGTDFYINKSSEYLFKSHPNAYEKYIDLDGQTKFRGDVYDIKANIRNYYSEEALFEFDKKLDDITLGDTCTKHGAYSTFIDMEVSIGGKIGNKTIPADIDKCSTKCDGTYPGDIVYVEIYEEELMELLFNKDPSFKDLKISDKISDLSPEEFEKLVNENGGKVSYKVSDFDKKVNEINDDVNKKSSEDNTTLYIIIAVVVILIIVIFALLIWYYKCRY